MITAIANLAEAGDARKRVKRQAAHNCETASLSVCQPMDNWNLNQEGESKQASLTVPQKKAIV
jgi:hypothetical protein